MSSHKCRACQQLSCWQIIIIAVQFSVDRGSIFNDTCLQSSCQTSCAGGAENLHHFRLLQRRFIVYRPKKAAGLPFSDPGGSSHPSMQSGQPPGLAESAQACRAVSVEPGASTSHGRPSQYGLHSFCLLCCLSVRFATRTMTAT